MKKIAVLCSGGDCPGMNPALFGILTAAKQHKIEPFAVIGGYDGLIDGKLVPLTEEMMFGRINMGGSVIKSCRSKRFVQLKNVKIAVNVLKNHQIDGLIVIGGDGSMRGAMDLQKLGQQVVCLPGTIDNDLNFKATLGYDTAQNNIVNSIDNILDCTSTFGYGAVVKIMGRTCPDLITSAATALYTKYVIKSSDVDVEKLAKTIKKEYDKNFPPLVLVLENVVDTVKLAEFLQEKCKIQMRPHILGYIQRGGKPSAFDRKYGYSAGIMAVEELIKGTTGYMIGYDEGLTKKLFKDSFKV